MTPFINIILARLLAPAEFGLVATFTLVVTFAEVFTDAGFQKYIVQHEFSSRQELLNNVNVAFWTNLVFSLSFWIAIVLFKDKLAELVGSPGHGNKIAVLGFQIPIVAFSSIQTALFRRDFKFKELLPIRLIVSLVPLLVTVPLAFFLRNCWALVLGNLIKDFINAVLLTLKSPWRPKLFYRVKILKEMLIDTLWLMADSFMIWMTSYVDVFIVSAYLSSHYLGIYKTGATTVVPYINLIFTMTAPVLFSSLSRLQNDREDCNQLFFTYQMYASYFIVLLGIFVFTFRDTVTLLLLGPNWGESSVVLGITGLVLSLSVITGQYNGEYFRAVGKPKIALLVQSAFVIYIYIALRWAVKKPFVVLCIVKGSLGLAYCFFSIIAMQLFCKVPAKNTILNLLPSLIGALFFYITANITKFYFGSSILTSVLAAVIGVVVYLLVLMLFKQSRHAVVNAAHKIIRS